MEGNNKKHRGGYSNYRKGGRGGGNNNSNNANSNSSNSNNTGGGEDGNSERPERVERRERGGREDRHHSREDRSTRAAGGDDGDTGSPPQRTDRGRGGRGGNRYDRGGRMDRGGGGGGQPRDDPVEERADPPRRERHPRGGHSHSPPQQQPSGPAPDYNQNHTTPPIGSNTPPTQAVHSRSPHQMLPPLPESASPPNGGNQKPFSPDPSHMFPSTPYTPAVDHFLNPALRSQVYGSPTRQEKDMTAVTVAGAKFQHFINIKTYDERPVETPLLSEGQKQQVYRCINRFSEKPVILRRIVDLETTPAECQAVHDRFRHFRHPTLVPLAGITQTQEFVLGSHDVVMETRLIKEAKSFKELFFADPEKAPIAESKVWSILCQLISLIKMFHEVEVPLRGIHWSKMLYVEPTERVMFSGIGIVDLGNMSPQATFTELARGDLMSLGILLLQLVLGSPAAQAEHMQILMQPPKLAKPSYSPELIKMIQSLIQPQTFVTVSQISAELGDRMATEVGQQSGHTDYYHGQCAKEVHNGRLMKLMIKLNFVIGSFQDSNDWGNDANERFALRLFHSYLFNQVDDRNQPRIDWFRVYSCLNKLDTGSDELVQLISADGNSTLLVISYADLKLTLEMLFGELQAAQDAALGTPPTMTTPGTVR